MIDSVRKTGALIKSADVAEIDYTTHRGWLEVDAEYAKAIKEALDAYKEALEIEVDRRASEGIRKYKFHQGEPIMVACSKDDEGAQQVEINGRKIWMRHYFEIEYSDSLLMFKLKKLDPSYRDSTTVTNNSIVIEDRQGEGIFQALRQRIVAADAARE